MDSIPPGPRGPLAFPTDDSPPAGAGRGTTSQNRGTCGGHRAGTTHLRSGRVARTAAPCPGPGGQTPCSSLSSESSRDLGGERQGRVSHGSPRCQGSSQASEGSTCRNPASGACMGPGGGGGTGEPLLLGRCPVPRFHIHTEAPHYRDPVSCKALNMN